MAKFVWHSNGEKPKAFVLKGTRVSIGRDTGADMKVDEPSVSTRHSMAIVSSGSVTLHDLESRNGTWVNGERITIATLKHGDVVLFGRMKATFIDESQAASDALVKGARGQTLTATERRPLGRADNGASGEGAGIPIPAALANDFAVLEKVLGAGRDARKVDIPMEDPKISAIKKEWQLTVQYARALKAKLADEPRVRFFEISERRNEVVLRVEKHPTQPMHLIQITLGHADRASHIIDGIWLRQSGSQDNRYEDHTAAMREVVATLASILA